MAAAAAPLRCCVALATAALCCLLAQCQKQTVSVGVLNSALYTFLSSNVSAGNYSGVRFTFKLLELNDSQLAPVNAASLYANISGLQAVVADYYIAMAVAAYSHNIPYFVTSKTDFSDMEFKNNMFQYEIDYTQLNETLYDVSTAMNRDGFTILSDDTITSDYFIGNFAGKPFVQKIFNANTTDAEIYDTLLTDNEVLLKRSWVLLFDGTNLALIERVLNQTGIAGRLQQDDVYFIPSLEEKQQYLQIIRKSDAVVYTFELDGRRRLNAEQLQETFLLDCFQHFALAMEKHRETIVRNENYTLLQAMYDVTFVGLSGSYSYTAGRRSNATLSVMSMDKNLPAGDFLKKVGEWKQGKPKPYELYYGMQAGIRNSVIRFAAVMDEPYVYRNKYGQLTGISIEIINMLEARLNFKKEIVFVDDKSYGALTGNNTWTGIMKYLVENRADISANFMATTPERMEFVDTSINLMQSGIQMLVKREIDQLDFFHVFYPFSWFVWVSILFSMIVLSGTLWLSDKISPNVEGKSIFTMMESFFLVFSSFLMSKVETEPRKPSARLFTLLLWFSTLFYMTTYVSNLVAFLVKPDDSLPFASIGELVNASSYRYSYIDGGSTFTTVNRKWPLLVARGMREWPEQMLQKTVHAAVDQLLSSDRFVFLESAATLRFQNTKHCNLRLYGGVEEVVYETMLIRRGFRYTSEVRSFLNSIRFTEFAKLEQKYFSIDRCPTSIINPNDKRQLGFNYFAGLFAMVGVGAILGFLYIFLHWAYKRVYEAVHRRGSTRLEYGHKYTGEIIKVIKDGIWITIKGRRQAYFIANSSLDPDPTKVKNAKSLGLHPGETMTVQYFGKDQATQNRIFSKLFEENLWYKESGKKDDSDSD